MGVTLSLPRQVTGSGGHGQPPPPGELANYVSCGGTNGDSAVVARRVHRRNRGVRGAPSSVEGPFKSIEVPKDPVGKLCGNGAVGAFIELCAPPRILNPGESQSFVNEFLEGPPFAKTAKDRPPENFSEFKAAPPAQTATSVAILPIRANDRDICFDWT